MTTNHIETPKANVSQPPPMPPAPSSPLRLLILLGLLLAAIGIYAYDFLVAKPGAQAANEKIQAFVDARNKLGVKQGSIVTPADIHKELGMNPTTREVHEKDDYEIEYYRWWGHVPLLNTRRHFISIVYLGKDPRRFSSHYLNEPPPDEALPIAAEPGQADGITLGPPENASPAEGDAPAKADDPAKTDDAAAPPPAEGKHSPEPPKENTEK
jgi:hypothetical protein